MCTADPCQGPHPAALWAAPTQHRDSRNSSVGVCLPETSRNSQEQSPALSCHRCVPRAERVGDALSVFIAGQMILRFSAARVGAWWRLARGRSPGAVTRTRDATEAYWKEGGGGGGEADGLRSTHYASSTVLCAWTLPTGPLQPQRGEAAKARTRVSWELVNPGLSGHPLQLSRSTVLGALH